jgi:hypothetical protein
MPKIDQLPTDAAPGTADLIPFVDVSADTTEATTIADLAASVAWSGQYQPLDSDLTTIAAANNGAVLAATTASFTAADETKLDGIAAGATTDAAITAHIADTSDAHDASAISIVDAGGLFSATDVEAALAEVKTIADTAGGGGVTLEQVQDDLGNTSLVAGTGITKTYNDVANTITIAVTSSTYQPLDSDLTTIAAANNGAVLAALDADLATFSVPASTTISTYGRTLVDDADATTARTTLGLGTAATATIADYLPKVAAGASVENIGAVESNVQTVAATGATETLDTSLYGVFDMTMDQNCTFTFSNPAPSGKATLFTLILRGAFTPTWPAAVDWPDATQPTYTTPSVYTFLTVDAGTTWLGAQAGKAFG